MLPTGRSNLLILAWVAKIISKTNASIEDASDETVKRGDGFKEIFDDAFDKTAIVKGGDDFEEISEDALDETVKEGDGLKEIFDNAFDKTATVKGADGFKGFFGRNCWRQN